MAGAYCSTIVTVPAARDERVGGGGAEHAGADDDRLHAATFRGWWQAATWPSRCGASGGSVVRQTSVA